MLDQVLGRPSKDLRRVQIFLVLFFWIWRLYKGDGAERPAIAGIAGTRRRPFFWRLWVSLVGRRAIRWMGKMNERLSGYFYRSDITRLSSRTLHTLTACIGDVDHVVRRPAS